MAGEREETCPYNNFAFVTSFKGGTIRLCISTKYDLFCRLPSFHQLPRAKAENFSKGNRTNPAERLLFSPNSFSSLFLRGKELERRKKKTLRLRHLVSKKALKPPQERDSFPTPCRFFIASLPSSSGGNFRERKRNPLSLDVESFR